MPARVTCCLLNWARPDNLRKIITALRNQTEQPTIFLWNNACGPFAHAGVEWQVHSSRNKVCAPRWWMASCAETEFVMTLDDDLIPDDERVIADLLYAAEKQPAGVVVGPWGGLIDGHYTKHHPVSCPDTEKRVDLVKGRCMVLRRAALARVSLADMVPIPVEDDLAICGCLAGGMRGQHICPGGFRGRFKELPAPQALECRNDHYQRRQAAVERWFGG